MKGICRICEEETEDLRHKNIYISGSEGLDVCPFCDNMIVDYIRNMIRLAGTVKKLFTKKNKKRLEGDITMADNKKERIYHITYRSEIMVTVRANNEEEAKEKALASTRWEFISDWWSEFVEVEEANLNY